VKLTYFGFYRRKIFYLQASVINTVNISHQTNPANKARSLTWKLIKNGQQIWHLVHEKNLLMFLMLNK